MGCIAFMVALALIAILLKLLPTWVAAVVGAVVLVVVLDRMFSGPDRRMLRSMRAVLRESGTFDGLMMACLPVTVAGFEHPPRRSVCDDCRGEVLQRTLAGKRRIVAVVTSGSLSFWTRRPLWSRSGPVATRITSFPFGSLRGLRQIEGAYSLLGGFRRAPVDPDRMPLKSATKHKLLLLFDDYSGTYLQARVRWDATMFHEAYSVVSGNVTMQALSLALTGGESDQPLTERLGLKPDATVVRELRQRELIDADGKLTPNGAVEIINDWYESTRTLRFVDPTESPESYRR